MGIILFIVSLILTVLASVISFFYHLFTGKWVRGSKLFFKWFTKLAISMDQFGNGSTGEFFTVLLINKEDRAISYKFGNIDETVSFVIGVNNADGLLNRFGRFIARVLNFIDKGHLEKSILAQKENDEKAQQRIEGNFYKYLIDEK